MLPTFRTRITGVSSLAVALLLALAFGVIYVVVRESSYSHLDEDISAEYEEALNNLDWADDSLVVRHMPEWEEAEHQQIEVNPTFVQVVDRPPDTAFVRGSNRVHVGAWYDGRARRVIVMSAIDNLVKGAAGQAIQAMNAAYGFAEMTGLDGIGIFP